MDVAKEISKGLADRIVIAKVDGGVWDLERPLEKSCSLELLDFEHPEGTSSSCAVKHHRIMRRIELCRKACLLAFIGTCPW